MADYEDPAIERRLGPAQRAWCMLMMLVILASAAALGAFMTDQINPESKPVLRLTLADLTPKPGFEL